MLHPIGTRVKTVPSLNTYSSRTGIIVGIYNDGTVIEYGVNFQLPVLATKPQIANARAKAWFIPTEIDAYLNMPQAEIRFGGSVRS
ncbi:MAG: hypothetical protein H0V81_17590 [Solirubrobacterales bacterium]|nr:hypothetical protein [Solirubrobacterales bacterium]